MAQSNMIGKLVDRAGIIGSGFSELQRSVIKATKHNTKPPKEKHVRRLLVYVHDQKHRAGEIIDLLARRLEVPDWIVVMKTLAVFHRILKESKPHFISELRYRSSIFNMRRFDDMTSVEAHNQSLFIRKYSQYLEEKVLVFKICNIEFEKDPHVTKSFTTEESLEKIPRLQSQMNALLNCRASKDHINNQIVAHAFTLLLKDSFKLYTALNEAIIALLESYFNLSLENAEKAIDIYKLFTRETDGINQFFEISRKFSRSDIPELQHAPTTLIDALQNYIDELKSGKNPNPNMGKTEKKSMKKAQKIVQRQMDDFQFDDVESDFEESGNGNLFDFGEPSPSKPAPSAAPSAASAAPAPSFDPFGNDPFGGDTFGSSSAASAPPQAQAATSPFGTTASSTASFDPFDSLSPPSATTSHVPYDAKKKQIEMLMTTNPNIGPSTMSQPLQPSKPEPAKNNPFGAPGGNPWASGGNNPFGAPANPQSNTNPFLINSNPPQQSNPFQPSNSNPFA